MRKIRPLYYVDLYSGDGTCTCPDAPQQAWEPPYINMLNECKENGLDLKCIFNDIEKKNIDSLDNKLKRYGNLVIKTYNADANKIYPETLNLIPPSNWSIFCLDPCKHDQLNFSTIEGIANHKAPVPTSGEARRPEMIITFMVYSILQTYKATKIKNISETRKGGLLKSIDNCLGTDSWRKEVSKWETSEIPETKMNYIFLKIFLTQLARLGYYTVVFQVGQTLNKSIIYYLIFSTSMSRAYQIMSKNFEPCAKEVMQDEWLRQNFTFSKMARAKEKGFALLDEFLY